MTHYSIPNSTLYGRAKGDNVSKELRDYSFDALQKRANLGNAEAKKLIKQLKAK